MVRPAQSSNAEPENYTSLRISVWNVPETTRDAAPRGGVSKLRWAACARAKTPTSPPTLAPVAHGSSQSSTPGTPRPHRRAKLLRFLQPMLTRAKSGNAAGLHLE